MADRAPQGITSRSGMWSVVATGDIKGIGCLLPEPYDAGSCALTGPSSDSICQKAQTSRSSWAR